MLTTDTTETRRYVCHTCGIEFTGTPVLWDDGRDLMARRACQGCVDARNEQRAQEQRDNDNQGRYNDWLQICPPLYRDTDLSRLPNSLSDALENWNGRYGLGFIGDAGKGKTRAAFEALRRRHYLGKSCEAITGPQLRRLLTDIYATDQAERSEARARFKRLRTVQVLLLDDLGKQKFTESAQEDLFDLLETRVSHCLPVIWTTNSGGKELATRLAGDQGGAILRRLVEFSTIVKA